MKIAYLYKNGKKKALTMSYDDGQTHDLRLIDIFNAHGIKGTFHLNSGKIGQEKRVTAEDVTKKYVGHEVSVHSVTHPYLDKIPDEELVYEIMEDRKNLEGLCGYPVRGMSYPYGSFDSELIGKLRTLGMQYARAVVTTGKFNLPDDFMAWHGTCHHNDPNLFEYLKKFQDDAALHPKSLPLFYVWGHSYEFPRDNNWDRIERFCAEIGNDPDVWYATNIEIYDYIMALRALRFSADRTMAYNPSAIDVWVKVDGEPVACPAGKVTKFI